MLDSRFWRRLSRGLSLALVVVMVTSVAVLVPVGPSASAAGSQLVSTLSGKCVEAAGGGLVAGTNAHLYDCNGTGAQVWEQVSQNGGFAIRNPQSGLCLDVESGSLDAGGNVLLWTCHGGGNQTFTQNGEVLRFQHSGLCFDANAGGVVNGTNIQQWTCNSTQAQNFSYDSEPVLPGPVRISEFLASNTNGILDEDGDASDWIELVNPTGAPADLSGWSLTDDASVLTKWSLPAATLPVGGRMLVFASGKNRAVAGQEQHTNFKLSAGGEYLALVESDGVTIADEFAPNYPGQLTDVSYGPTESDPTEIGYFVTPTPGSANGVASAGFVEPVTISPEHGFYTSAQTISLSTPTGGAIIRYTVDGSEPSAVNGTNYVGPFVVNQTTTLRAAAVVPGFIAAQISTATYLFVDDVLTQSSNPAGFPIGSVNSQVLDYGMDPDIVNNNPAAVRAALQAIPSISVVTDMDNLFDPASGIYANPEGSGQTWERPASVELIDPSGAEPGFEIAAGLRIRGGFSRSGNNPKHAFRLFFRGGHGGSLDYPLFGSEGADSFEKVDLRTAQNYSWSFRNDDRNTFLREVFARDTQADMGQPYTRSRYYHLYLNGQYWGVYQSQERVSKEYGATYFGGSEDDYDVVKHDRQNDYRYNATDGNDAAWRALWPIIQDQAISTSEYDQLDAAVDFDSLIDAQLIYIYSGDIDGSPSRFLTDYRGNNWYALRNRTGVGPAGKWQFFVHDAEHSLGARDREPDIDRTGPFPVGGNNPYYSVDYMHPYWIHNALMSHPDYVARFEARANQLLRGNGAFTASASQARWDEREEIISQAILAESARWGDAKSAVPYTVGDWSTEVAWVESNWFPSRTQTVISQLGLPAVLPNDPPVITAPGPQSSVVANDAALTVSATDPDGDAVVWTAVGLPNGLTIDAESGLISGQALEAGDFSIALTATDPLGEFDSKTFVWTATFPAPSRMILNEWNAVDSAALLKNGGTDSVFGAVVGNGGDWFELVVIEDNLDIRGWTLELSDNDTVDGAQEVTDTFVFADQPLLSSLRAGTILTISEDIADDVSYDPAAGDWHINLQANSNDDGAFFTGESQSNFGVNNDNWQLIVRDAVGAAVFGPAGEGAGASGVGSDEIGELEADPSGTITPASLFDDGNDSTFGAPNGFDARFQDFSLIRPVLADTTEPESTISTPLLGQTVETTTVTIGGTASDNVGVDSVAVSIRNRDTGDWLRRDGSFGTHQFINAIVDTPGESTIDWSISRTLPEGRWLVVARAEDSSGNRESTRPSVRFEVAVPVLDAEDPNGELVTPTLRETVTGPTVTLTGTATDDIAVERVRVTIANRATGQILQADGTFGGFARVDATVVSPGSPTTEWTFSADLPDGDYAVTVDVIDSVGKQDQTRQRVPFTVNTVPDDTIDPDTTIDSPLQGATIVGPSLSGTGTATDNVGVTEVRVGVQDLGTTLWLQPNGTFGPRVLLNATLDSNGATNTGWTIPLNLPPGDYALTARALDAKLNRDNTRPRVRFTVTN